MGDRAAREEADSVLVVVLVDGGGDPAPSALPALQS